MSPKQKELQLTETIRSAIRKEWPNSWDLKVLGGNFQAGGRRMSQRAGVPDLLVVVGGKFFGLEVKRPKKEGGGNATEKQQHELRKIRQAGGHATVVRTAEEALQFIRKEL